MGAASDGGDEVFHRLPTTFTNIIAPELDSGESSVLLLVLLVLIMFIGGGRGDSELLSSNLEPCPQHGGSTQDLHCSMKMFLQLPIIHGKGTQSDTTETLVTHVQESGGASKALDVPYRITIYKSDVYAQYPINYIQSFNDNPHEEVISSPHCQDSQNDRSPDCGWLYNNDGEKEQDSQGFCCLCNTENNLPIVQQKNKSPRISDKDCNTTWLPRRFSWTRFGSAHCLRLSQKWYPTYQLGEPILSTSVRVVVQRIHSSEGQPYRSLDVNFQTLHLSSQRSTQVHPMGALRAHLQGDFEFNIQLPLLQDRYLSIPMEEGKSEKIAHVNQWLTLPKDYFTLDGKECDKIGVSYSAFKSQAKACDQPFQSCCGKQLHFFAQEDSQRMLGGEAPIYAFSQYGKALVQDGNDAVELTTLNLNIDKEKLSLLTLELEADALQYYIDRSTGKILKADIARFEKGTNRLLLQVEVMNMGILKKMFKIKVVDCTTTVEIFPVEIITPLVPARASSFWLDLSLREDLPLFNSNAVSCKVVLFDAFWEMSKTDEMLFKVPLHGHFIPQHISEPKFSQDFSLFNFSGWCFIWCSTPPPGVRVSPPPPKIGDPCTWYVARPPQVHLEYGLTPLLFR